MNALLLALCAAIGADDFQWAVTDASAFSWSITTNGGDASLPQDAAVPGTDAPPSSGSAVEHSAISPAAEPSTAICPCLGYRGREHCFCLQRGVKCRCNRTTGSEWEMADGRPVKKTGRYDNPSRQGVDVASTRVDEKAEKQGSTAPKSNQATENSESTTYEVTRRTDGRYWWTVGNTAFWVGKKPVDGDSWTINGQVWECSGGRMQLKGAKMAADIAPKAPKGHWETRCFGPQIGCRNVWVPE